MSKVIVNKKSRLNRSELQDIKATPPQVLKINLTAVKQKKIFKDSFLNVSEAEPNVTGEYHLISVPDNQQKSLTSNKKKKSSQQAQNTFQKSNKSIEPVPDNFFIKQKVNRIHNGVSK